MEQFIKVTLFLHAVSGGIALVSGILAIITKKGGKQHILSGKVYFWSMLSVIVSGLIVGMYRGNVFLQTIAVFSFYMAFTGKRVLRYKKEAKPELIDWAFNILSMLVGFSMLALAVKELIRIGFAGVAPMLVVFGGLLTWMTLQDLVAMRKKKSEKGAWLLTHISRMGGSFIATSTAFLLVNIRFEPSWIMWLLPTVIGTPLLISTSKKWKKKMSPKQAIK